MSSPQTARELLSEQLRARFEHALATRTPEQNATMSRMIESLRAVGTGAGAPGVGELAPPFELPNAHGEVVRLGDVLQTRAAVVAFYRGGWCPYCNIQLRAYDAHLADIRRLGGELIAISPETPDHTVATRQKNALRFEVLSDTGNAVARAYSLVFEVPLDVTDFYLKDKGVDLGEINGDGRWELPVPGTFVIARDGTIALASVDVDYTRRLEPSAILDALDRLR